MRPKRYPYSGQKESTFVKADPELVEKLLRNTSFLECLQKKPINFR
ncbi:Phage protein [Streptococcus pneumoniae]|nr:Phage protein [Streptococcus pneumoniae]VTG18859.1 Phage protein [Streptococcus pneumoniae]VTG32091.1 Phage protein [Streptococcus pneumoniae]